MAATKKKKVAVMFARQVSGEQFDKTFKTNIYGYFFMAKAALEYMKECACIINTGRCYGSLAELQPYLYRVSEQGLTGPCKAARPAHFS